MRLPRLKLSVRGWMLLIAVSALGMASYTTTHRYKMCIRRADEFRSKRDYYRQGVRSSTAAITVAERESEGDGAEATYWRRNLPSMRNLRAYFQALASHYESRRAYYARAAYTPTLAIPSGEDYLPADYARRLPHPQLAGTAPPKTPPVRANVP